MIQLGKTDTAILLACKGWDIDDKDFYHQSSIEDWEKFDVEEFIKKNSLEHKMDSIRIAATKDIKTLSDYPQITRVYMALYGCEIDYSTHNIIIEILTNIAFKISPLETKKAFLSVYGDRGYNQTFTLLSAMRSVLAHCDMKDILLDTEYAPEKYLKNKLHNKDDFKYLS